MRTVLAPGALRERVGEVIGRAWVPAIATISAARRARMFHPVGHMFDGRVERTAVGAFEEVGQSLTGRVLARCSGALWKHPVERFEVLGIALRFRRSERAFTAAAEPGDQDLLFATIISPLTMIVSPLTTNGHDFLANIYYGVSPFTVANDVRVKLRLRPLPGPDHDGTADDSRANRLRTAVSAGRAVFVLEARVTLTRDWHPIARVVLEREIDLDQEALRFDPFRIGAGIAPSGLVHAIRRAVYPASQWARPSRS